MDETKEQAAILQLQEQINSIKQSIVDYAAEATTRYVSREFVTMYVEQMLGDIMPIDNPFTENTSMLGYVSLDITKVLKHFQNIGGSYTINDYRNILMSYDATSKKGNINPYIAVAQMVKEADWGRSWWSQRPRRNPAGIGVTGEKSIKEQDRTAWAFDDEMNVWKRGYSFASWEIASQAHIGHLLAYIYKQADLTIDQAYLVANDPRAKAIPIAMRGAVKLLKHLDGHWAVPGVGYGRSIAIIANALRT